MSQSDIEVILYRLSDLDKKMDEVRDDLKKSDIIRDVRIRSIESTLDQLRGAGAAGKAVWAFIGAGAIGTATWISNIVMTKI